MRVDTKLVLYLAIDEPFRRDSLEVRGKVSVVEELFQTAFSVFKHQKTQRPIIAHKGQSSIPKHIKQVTPQLNPDS